ncbi:MAG: hypothetical protein Q8Q59_05985, partial [Luteolibacter sp.]|nr:hypothetical protein [Luteolibacter sp.]
MIRPLFVSLSIFCLATLCAATGPAITNGTFSGKTPGGEVPGWRLSPGATVETDAGRPALVLRSTAPGSASASQEMVCDPEWAVLRFRYRVSVPAITPGTEGWHNARIALSLTDKAGKVTHKVAGEWSKPTAGWITAEQLVELPLETIKMGIGPAIFSSTGELRLADLKVELAARRGEGIDAQAPKGQEPKWGTEPVEKPSPRREAICLNGLWRFMPASGPAATTPAKSGWGWLRVPGSWRNGPLPAPTRGTGPMWEGFTPDAPVAWYQRNLTAPASWSGRAIILDLQRVCTDAVVFIDGREAGKISWPGGEVDLTAAVKPGKTHSLLVKVVAVADKGEVTRFMGIGEGQILKEKVILATRGIVGDVILSCCPVGAHLTGCGIRTTVKAPSADGKSPAQGDALTLVVDYAGLRAAGEVTLTAVARDAAGAEVRRFTTKVQAAAGDGSVTAFWKWNDPLLWDIKTPNLYTLDLVLQGSGINDTLRETFGFREFRVDGKRFLLNGAEIRLRPGLIPESGPAGVSELIGDALDGLHWAGFNIAELWPWDRDERGTWEFDELWCREADRRGFLLIMPALGYPPGLSDAWNNPSTGPPWAARMAPLLKRLRNHPSVVMWVTGTNRFGHGQDQNPVAIGSRSRAWLNHDGWRHGAEGGLKAMRWIKEVDPTRPAFMHAGGPVGDVYTSNNYLCLTPLQEREEWPSRWAADGDMPVMMVEFGTPLYTSFHRGRRGYAQASTSEPLYSEFCAIYQGADAYRLESPAYRATLASTFEKEMLWSNWHGIEVPRLHDGFNQLQALFQKNTWRTWRTWGVTGGMVPWGSGHGWLRGGTATTPPVNDPLPLFKPGRRGVWKPDAPRNLTRYFRPEGMPLTVAGKALVAANQETLAWIAGAPDFVDKTHHVRAGTTLAKQAVIINDGRSPLKWSLTCRAELDGTTIIEGTDEGEIAPASTSFVPLVVAIPDSLKSDRAPGVIHLTCMIGDTKHEDSFPFTAFRAKTETAAPRISLLDPVGDTTALLRTLNITPEKWDGQPSKNLVVIGRNAFARSDADPTTLIRHLKGGGRVLLMAQDPAWLRERLGLRVAAQLPRRAFPVIPNHPALAGLDAEAFHDWAGESRLVPPVDAPNETVDTPPHGWRWGARHVLSSAAIEIPHRAGWRPILACEFDGAYTPLAEISVAGGALTFCTLDLEDHAADPAAERVARAVLAAAASSKPETRAPAIYLGGGIGEARLNASGIAFQHAKSLPPSGTVVIGPDASVTDAALDAFLRSGGRALILPRASAEAPLGVRLTATPNHPGSLAVPAWSSCRGIGPGELRRRADGPAWIVTSGADAIGADGLLAEVRRGTGVALFFQLDSSALDADRLSYNRFTRWRWTRALSQIASNMGILCAGDARLVQAAGPPAEISLSGTWKAALTMPLPVTGTEDPHPADKGPSPAALALVTPDADERGMQDVPVSRHWRGYGGAWAKADGEALFRRTIHVPAAWAGKDLSLSLGVVDDFDTTYFDGVAVGSTSSANPKAWTAPRLYTVPGNLVKPGSHVIAVRIFDHFNGGGLVGKANELRLTPKEKPANTPAALYHPDFLTDF